MLLVIDVGNTNVVFGVYDGDKLAGSWRVSTDKDKTTDEYGLIFTSILERAGLEVKKIKAAIISSVVPPLLYSLPAMCERYFSVKPMIVGPGIKTGIPIKYDNPKELGADRIVNAVAAVHKYGAPLIIVDSGTAITFCVVNEKGEYLGGLIYPGIGISTDALFMRAAKLPKVEIVKPERVIGKTTVSAIQSGIFHGYVGMVDHIIDLISAEIATPLKNIKLVATGGFGQLLTGESKHDFIIDRMLTVEGLKLIYEKNIGEA